ncbi:MAG TPA: GtrA family protein [Dehalococcoidia bacterium]|nr:GtrA family protein [Dehalococcoidia bacterium]
MAATRLERLYDFAGSGAARPVRFGAVGAVTFVVQIASLLALRQAGIGSLVAYALALFISVQFNFVVNQALVWGDRKLAARRLAAIAERWLTFHACIGASLVINFAGFAIAQAFVPDLAAAVFGVGVSTLVKFLSLDRLAFRPAGRQRPLRGILPKSLRTGR